MINNVDFPIKVFVFGTLRKGGRLEYYMNGSIYSGKYYTEGQLMKSEIGSAYIDFNTKNVATMGELYYLDFPGLLRIDHLESTSGEFPKGYDLDLAPIWKYSDSQFTFNSEEENYAFVYKRRNEPIKITSGDWINRPKPIDEIKKFLENNNNKDLGAEGLISHMLHYLKK
ncbi:MAG: gamma-glutamylcyclotransferase [Bacteroidales bacterium]|nr:gamma-glutamylcyclotransferase [Bacteroidales bacterium]